MRLYRKPIANNHCFLSRLMTSLSSTSSPNIIGVLVSGGSRTAQHSALGITRREQRNKADRGEAQLEKRHSQVQLGDLG